MQSVCETKRDARLDFMRALGTLTTIVPHVLSPDLLVQIRTFDVIMLVMISGMSFTLQNQSGKTQNYLYYLKRRIVKLLKPTFILIIVVVTSMNFGSVLMSKEMSYGVEDVIKSILLFEEGIGYVWIIKVYIAMAVIAPIAMKAVEKIENTCMFFSLCTLIFIAYIGIKCTAALSTSPLISVVLSEYVFYLIAYSIPFLIGMYFCYRKDEEWTKLIWFIIPFIIVQIVMTVNGRGFVPNDNKYPPDLYYLSYGVACSLVIYKIAPKRIPYVVTWLSKNSLVFYLVQVFWVLWLSRILNSLHINFLNLYWVKFIIIVSATSLTVVIIQNIGKKIKRGNR